jgi:hypothetical protein
MARGAQGENAPTALANNGIAEDVEMARSMLKLVGLGGAAVACLPLV